MSRVEGSPIRVDTKSHQHVTHTRRLIPVIEERTSIRVWDRDEIVWKKDVYFRLTERSYKRRIARKLKKADKTAQKLRGDSGEPTPFVDYPSVSEQTLS